MKLKYQTLSNPINLRDWDDIHYIELESILMHDMMVKARMEKDEMVDGTMYNSVNNGTFRTEYEPSDNCDDNNVIHLGEYLIDGVGNSAIWDRSAKFEMRHNQWEVLYDFEGSTKLRDVIKRHMYKVKFGDEVIVTGYEMINGYKLLLFKINFATVNVITPNYLKLIQFSKDHF